MSAGEAMDDETLASVIVTMLAAIAHAGHLKRFGLARELARPEYTSVRSELREKMGELELDYERLVGKVIAKEKRRAGQCTDRRPRAGREQRGRR